MDCKGWDKVSYASFFPSPAPSAGTEQQEAELARYLALDAAVLGGDLGVDVGGEGARVAVHAVQALDVLALLPLQRAEGAVGAQVHVVPPEVVTHLGGIQRGVRGEKDTENLPTEEAEEFPCSCLPGQPDQLLSGSGLRTVGARGGHWCLYRVSEPKDSFFHLLPGRGEQ